MECYFCGKEVPKGKGTIYSKKDGTTYLFCSGKCRKNMLKLKRVGKNVNWTIYCHSTKKMVSKKKKGAEA